MVTWIRYRENQETIETTGIKKKTIISYPNRKKLRVLVKHTSQRTPDQRNKTSNIWTCKSRVVSKRPNECKKRGRCTCI